MEVTNELIAKFFRQECTPGERALISDYFDQHPEELDKYINEEDWQTFEADAELHPAVSELMLQNIEESIVVPGRVKKINVKRWLAAASVILVAGAALFIGLRTSRYNSQKLANNTLINSTSPANDTVINKTGKELAFSLPDGSKIMLEAKSQVSFNKAFNQKHRDIYLSGEAVFKVAKDKTRPFTVYASGLSTTALGTCFRVTAFNNNSHVSVKLYEGKVVIKHTQAAKGVLYSDVYLTPGYQMQWDNGVKKASVIAFNNTDQPPVPFVTATESKTVNGTVKFNNTRLANVLDELQQMYHIHIKMVGSTDNKFFTGSVDSHAETAEDVLRTIAILNKFNIKKQGDAYVLTAASNMAADSVARLK